MSRPHQSNANPIKRVLRSAREIKLMRQAGLLVWLGHQAAWKILRPGVTTLALNQAVADVFASAGAEPLFLGYPGKKSDFPAETCISVNEQIVHGIPGNYELVDGDIVSIDTGCRINHWCGDAAVTHRVGAVSSEKEKLLKITHEVLDLAIELCATETNWSEVAKKIQSTAESNGLSVVEELVGHGIGQEMHEAPSVPNFYDPNVEDFKIRPGVVIAIEPMLNAGQKKVKYLDDGWTIVTADKKPSAHFEHTVAITSDGPQRLTGPPGPEELEQMPPWLGAESTWLKW